MTCFCLHWSVWRERVVPLGRWEIATVEVVIAGVLEPVEQVNVDPVEGEINLRVEGGK